MKRRLMTILLVPFAIVAVIAIVFLVNFITWEPVQSSSFRLETISFATNNLVYLSSSGIEFDEALRDELNHSRFTLVFEIDDRPTQWTTNYSYQYNSGDDRLDRDYEDEGALVIDDWEYGKEYTFTIRFLCDSQNVTVQELPFLNEDLYVRGSFIARNKQIDTVVFTVDEGTQIEEQGVQWIVYFGEIDEIGRFDNDALVIGYGYEGQAIVS